MKQVAQLSQRDRAAGWVSYGQKWKTVNGRQHFTDIIQGGPKMARCFLLLISLKCVVTEVVMFSIVAFKTLDISQGSVATHLRRGGIFSDSLITHFLLILKVK